MTVASDMLLCFRQGRGPLTWALASYIDDTLACGDTSFSQLTEKLEKLRYQGTWILKHAFLRCLHCSIWWRLQHSSMPCIDRLKLLPSSANFVTLQKYRIQLPWLINSRPGVGLAASKLAQVRENSLNTSHRKQYNTTKRYLQHTRHLSLRMWKHDPEILHIRSCADVSFRTNSDYSFQLSYIVLLSETAKIHAFCTTPATRVTKSPDPY